MDAQDAQVAPVTSRWSWWTPRAWGSAAREAEARRTLVEAWIAALRRHDSPVVLDWLLQTLSPAWGTSDWSTALGATPFMAALHDGSEEVVLRVLEVIDPDERRMFVPMIPGDGAPHHGEPREKVHPLAQAAARGFERVVERLLPAHRQDQALLDVALGSAAQANRPELVEKLLPLVEHPSCEWLRHAISRGHDEVVQRLLLRVESMTTGRNQRGMNQPALAVAMYEAILFGQAGTLQRLLNAPSASQQTNVELLNEAARIGYVECVKAVMATVDPRSKNSMGWTPLMAAAVSQHTTLDVIDLLLPLSDTSARVELGTAFDAALAATISPSTPAHVWARLDRLAFHEPNVARVNEVFDQVGAERMPLWAIRREQDDLAALVEEPITMEPAPTVRRPRL